MSHITDIFNASPVFEALEDDEIQRLEPLFSEWKIQPGDILASAGEAAQVFFLLDKGTLLLDMDGGRSVVLNTSGDFIGLELLSAKGMYKTTVTVLEKGSVFVIPRQDFLDVIQEDSVAAATIMACWQEYLGTTASFAKEIDDLDLPEIF